MKPLLIIAVLIVLGGTSFYFYKYQETPLKVYSTPLSSPDNKVKGVDITAKFKVITNGTTRIFTDKKYHNLSSEVFITSQNPNIIEVKNNSITWSDFFKTLPMSLDKNCLVTGTKQTFCTNDVNKLVFIINGTEDPNILDKNILDGDYLLIEYK
ncbi:MAG: hypothetical protein QY322_03365 [bacterium]|nr:MAG: hypothetical protein QY322_03365 [bacterium]